MADADRSKQGINCGPRQVLSRAAPKSYYTVQDDQMMVSRGDIGPATFKSLPVGRRLDGNWASLAENLSNLIVPASADVHDNADRRWNVSREGVAQRLDRANRSRRPADCYDSVHINLRQKSLNETVGEEAAASINVLAQGGVPAGRSPRGRRGFWL